MAVAENIKWLVAAFFFTPMYVASVGCIWLRWGIAHLMTKCHDQPPAVLVPSRGMLNPFASCFGWNYRLPDFFGRTLRGKNMYKNVLEDLGRLQ